MWKASSVHEVLKRITTWDLILCIKEIKNLTVSDEFQNCDFFIVVEEKINYDKSKETKTYSVNL